MARARPDPLAIRLASRLAESNQPLYVVAPSGEIEFVNEALARCFGLSENALVGRVCRYHSQTDPSTADAVAAALCPPPEVFAGVPAEANLQLALSEARQIVARVRFVPLGRPDNTNEGFEKRFTVLATLELNPPASSPLPATSEAVELHAQLQALRTLQFSKERPARLCGSSAEIRRACAQIELATASSANVLIVAPPGARSNLIARQIHAERAISSRAVVIDGPRMDAEDIRDLSVHWHSAQDHRPSSTVTLFGFDIDQLSAEAQLELEARLRAAHSSVRTICTATQSLETLAQQQLFRHELAYRLSTLTIELPALTERPGDLPLLAQALVEELNATSEKQLGGFSSGALDRLADHDWRGDLEELAEVTRLAFENSSGPLIAPGDLSPQFVAQLRSNSGEARRTPSLDLEAFLGELETELLQRALALAKGNKTKAAKMLGMTRPRLYRRLVQLGLEQAVASETLDEIDWSEASIDESTPGEVQP